jgi:hypothetical protein
VAKRAWQVEIGRIDQMDRSFDLAFWRKAGAVARFDAAWQLVVDAHAIKGKDPRELEFQGSLVRVERAPRPIRRGRGLRGDPPR